MNLKTFHQALFLQIICFIMLPAAALAQCGCCQSTTLDSFYDCYGGESIFGTHSIDAVTTFIQAEDAIKAGEFAQAKTMVEELFETYPKGNPIWWNVNGAPLGANLGTPHAYYGLRMIEDIVDHALNGDPTVEAQTAYMKVLLVGCAEGIQPTTLDELNNGTGPFVSNTIDPAVQADDYRIVHQSLEFFSTYVTAITGGQLKLEIEIVELPEVCMDVNVSTTLPHVASGSIEPVWDALSDEVKNNTDWWWILYPSHVPEAPVMDDFAFITGGMGLDQKAGPAFIIDDKWIVRKPPHLGAGDYSDIERRIYLPQWLQHEFFHHLYRAYPELELEVNGHDWFNLDFWPADFEGRFEPDYYAETLHKRLQLQCTPMATKLITRVNDDLQALYSDITMLELLGPYSKDIIENEWHDGEILKIGVQYFWRNKANVQWELFPNLAEGILETGTDCPYPGLVHSIELYRTVEGDFIPGAVALRFQSEFYQKRFDLLRDAAPIEIALGPHERVPNETTEHTGNLIKAAGQLFWRNDAGSTWSLIPNAEEENFSLNADSPTPDEIFELVLTETDCGLYALGYKYVDHYYWKPKRIESNASPILANEMADLVLEENFGTHTIDLSDVFQEPDGEPLLLFATSEASGLITTSIDAQQLVLSGGAAGNTVIYVMGLDANGGLAVDEFTVTINLVNSTNELSNFSKNISVYPTLTCDYIYLEGASMDYEISLLSIDNAYQQELTADAVANGIDLSRLATGVYLLVITDPTSGQRKVEKVVKY